MKCYCGKEIKKEDAVDVLYDSVCKECAHELVGHVTFQLQMNKEEKTSE